MTAPTLTQQIACAWNDESPATCGATFTIDQVMAMAQALRPDLKPGVRMVAGKPWTYDENLLLSYEAREAVRAAPADLSDLSDDEIDALCSAAMRRSADTGRREVATEELFERAADERAFRAAVTIPVLEPVMVAVRRLNPALWPQLKDVAE